MSKNCPLLDVRRNDIKYKMPGYNGKKIIIDSSESDQRETEIGMSLVKMHPIGRRGGCHGNEGSSLGTHRHAGFADQSLATAHGQSSFPDPLNLQV